MSKEKSKEKVEFVVTKTLGRVVKLVLFPYNVYINVSDKRRWRRKPPLN